MAHTVISQYVFIYLINDNSMTKLEISLRPFAFAYDIAYNLLI